MNTMNPAVKPGMIIHKGIEPDGTPYKLVAYEGRNGATIFADAIPTLKKLNASFELHNTLSSYRKRAGRGYYMWYYDMDMQQYEATKIDPVVQLLIQEGVSNKEMSFLLSQE